MTLQLPRTFADAIVVQARTEHPNEACGLLAGTNGTASKMPAPPILLPGLLEQLCHEARPPGLMTGAQSGSGIAVEIFVE